VTNHIPWLLVANRAGLFAAGELCDDWRVLLPLPRSFYAPSAAVVAEALLGHLLIRRHRSGACGGVILETEAYLADDPASHGYGGETVRNRSMYGEPGRAYVYLIYGLHYCVNAVCQPKGRAEAVLIRAIEAKVGLERMRTRRRVAHDRDLVNGPGKLCAALDIDRRLDGQDLCDPGSPLIIAENPERESVLLRNGPVRATPRIGISKAADWPLRFVLEKHPGLSRRG
jgi:DNA-3-methyladenine glycosylase